MKDSDREIVRNTVEALKDKLTTAMCLQVASSLFQLSLETKNKTKWSSAEDDMICTFFYSSSKEELCEALQCDMQSLYKRASMLGVVSPSFQSLEALDLILAVELFQSGKTQEEVLSLFGIHSVTVPVQTLNMNHYKAISESSPKFEDPKQMGLFPDED